MMEWSEKLFPYVLVRWGGLPLQSLMEQPSHRFQLFVRKKRYLDWLQTNQDRLIDALYATVQKEQGTPLATDLVVVKRSVYNGRLPKPHLMERVLDRSAHRLRRLLKTWYRVLLQVQELNEVGQEVQPEEEVNQLRRMLELVEQHPEFQQALTFSDPSLYRSLRKYLQQPIERVNSRERKFQVSLVKFLTRSLYKTSPFSYFGRVGVGRWQETPTKSPKPSAFRSYSRLNETIRLRLLEAQADRYHRQPGLWLEDNRLLFFKREEGPKPEITFQIQESISQLERNEWTDFWLNVTFPEEGFRVKELLDLAAGRFPTTPRSELLKWIEQTIEIQLLKKVPPQSVQGLDELESLANGFAVESADDRLKTMQLIQEGLRSLGLPPNSFPVYEDVVDTEPVELSCTEWEPALKDLSLLHDLLPLFDRMVVRRQMFAEHFRREWNGSTCNLPGLVADYFSFWNEEEEKGERPDELREADELLETLQESILKQRHRELIEVNIPLWRQVADLIPTAMQSSNASSMFFVQPSKSHSLTLNKIYSGFGRCFSRFANGDETLAAEWRRGLDMMQSGQPTFLDLASSYGSNTNLHPKFTGKSLDDVALTDLQFVYDNKGKRIEVRTTEGEPVLPLHVGQMSMGNLPVSHRFLASLTHSDQVDLNLSSLLFNSLVVENPNLHVYPVPEVRLGCLTLLRKQWWIQNQWLVERLKSLTDWEAACFLFSFFEEHDMPFRFFMSPSRYSRVRNFQKINDYYKPQYIDLRSELSMRVFKKNVLDYGAYLLIEEVRPDFADIYECKTPTRQVEFGIELYRKP